MMVSSAIFKRSSFSIWPLYAVVNELYPAASSQIQLLEGLKTVSTVVLSLVADAPAQCLMMNMMQSNGNFGCSCCLAAGESCIIGESGHSRIYMYNLEDNSVNGYEQPRLTIQHYCMQSKELKIFITAENPTLNQCME